MSKLALFVSVAVLLTCTSTALAQTKTGPFMSEEQARVYKGLRYFTTTSIWVDEKDGWTRVCQYHETKRGAIDDVLCIVIMRHVRGRLFLKYP